MTALPAVTIGVLGAARIVDSAILKPSREVPGVTVAAVAARDRQRAQEYAGKHGIPRVHDDYAALLADPALDAVYIPLPSSLHAKWILEALAADKHVLVEKPFTSNAADAERVAARAASSSRVVMEAYHSHYHPLQRRLRQILDAGEIGEIREARATFCAPIPPGKNIRWNLDLGGGGLLDMGYYAVRQLTELFGDPRDITASARERGGVDRLLEASFAFEGGIRGSVVSSMWSRHVLSLSLVLTGQYGRIRVRNPYHPQLGGRIMVKTSQGTRREKVSRRSSYAFQLEAFRDAVRSGDTVATDARAGADNMRTIDAIYRAAGMQPRP